MKDYKEFIDITLSDLKDNPKYAKDLEEYKYNLKNEMCNRELELRERGLSDYNVIKDLIISENLDARHNFLSFQHNKNQRRIEKIRMIFKFILAIAYFCAIGIWYFLDSFYNDDWAHSWLIIAGGITVFIIMLFLMPNKLQYKGRRFFSLTVALEVSGILAAIYTFLVLNIVFKIEHAAVIIPAILTLTSLSIAIIPAMKKMKMYIVYTLIGIILASTFIYIALSYLHLVPWQIGWLIIIAGIIVDLVILLIYIAKKEKAPEVDFNAEE
ncbi:MAG: hypothetical protein PUD72_05195 [Oscillospiraceae bacterium]|nr:hypothetical protein [Oscillospiraceae bacterium]